MPWQPMLDASAAKSMPPSSVPGSLPPPIESPKMRTAAYSVLSRITIVTGSSWRAAVQSAWMPYMLDPSPTTPTTLRSGRASAAPTAPGTP